MSISDNERFKDIKFLIEHPPSKEEWKAIWAAVPEKQRNKIVGRLVREVAYMAAGIYSRRWYKKHGASKWEANFATSVVLTLSRIQLAIEDGNK